MHSQSSIINDPTFRTIEVLRTSHMSSPAKLSAEIIINLSENGVGDDVFRNLMRSGLNETAAGLTCWDSGEPHAMANLWINVARSGGVITARLARIAAGESRARGFGDREEEDSDGEDEDEDAMNATSVQRSTAWWLIKLADAHQAWKKLFWSSLTQDSIQKHVQFWQTSSSTSSKLHLRSMSSGTR